VSEKRLSLTTNGDVRYQLKTQYRNGTTQVAFDRGGHPTVDFMALLAALVPISSKPFRGKQYHPRHEPNEQANNAGAEQDGPAILPYLLL